MTKPKTIPLRHKAPSVADRGPLSLNDVLRHAEAIIRFDRESALRTQQEVTDLVQSRDGKGPSGQLTSLEELCGLKGALKLTSKDAPPPRNIVPISAKNKKD